MTNIDLNEVKSGFSNPFRSLDTNHCKIFIKIPDR